MSKMPRWKTPKDIAKALADGDGFWEDERWSPILLTAMSGTEYKGRAIPIAWQIEFDPSEDDFKAANLMGVEPDGYGWGEYIQDTIRKNDPGLAEMLHITDCETDTCVIWVESEANCRVLLEGTWKLVFAE